MLFVELYIPEYIKPFFLCSSAYNLSKVELAITPLEIFIALKSSLILFDSIPLPNEKQLYQPNPVSVRGLISNSFLLLRAYIGAVAGSSSTIAPVV